MSPHYPKTISPSFKKRANEAAFWEAWVGAVLARAGLYTLHYPFTADGADYHALSFDLGVAKDSSGPFLSLECKGLSLTFTVPEDYPFETCLVCSNNSWKKKWPDSDDVQRDFLFISRETGAIVWLPKGAPTMVKKTKDRSREQEYWVRCTDSKNLEPFIGFVEMVRG